MTANYRLIKLLIRYLVPRLLYIAEEMKAQTFCNLIFKDHTWLATIDSAR